MLQKNISYLVVLIFLLQSCTFDFARGDEQGKVVARVGDSYLYQKDIAKLIKDDMSKTDSALIVDRYIDRWARKKIFLQKAELNLSAKETDFSRLIEEYREGLIASAYRQKLVYEYLDSIVTDKQIIDFYQKNKSNFILNNDLVMVKYVVLPANFSEKDKIIDLIKSDRIDDLTQLESMCYQFSKKFSINDSIWTSVNDIKMRVPQLKDIENDKFLKKESFIEKHDSLNLYLIRILDVRKKKEIAPLLFVEEHIHNIILNKRKLELMKNMETQLVEDAIKKGEFEIYK